jgi:hypothetical protein
MFRFFNAAFTTAYPAHKDCPEVFPGPDFAAELHAAREECAHRSRQAQRRAAQPSERASDQDSMTWLNTRTRLKNATVYEMRALAVAENEEWAEDCDHLVLESRKPRAPRTIDY